MADALAYQSSRTVDSHTGKQLAMYHCTGIQAAKQITASQKFWGGDHPSRSGADRVGPGVYLSKDRQKAESYRNPSGSGPVLVCRVKVGECIVLRDQQDVRGLPQFWNAAVWPQFVPRLDHLHTYQG